MRRNRSGKRASARRGIDPQVGSEEVGQVGRFLLIGSFQAWNQTKCPILPASRDGNCNMCSWDASALLGKRLLSKKLQLKLRCRIGELSGIPMAQVLYSMGSKNLS
jgi:hypothetical protein